MTTIQERAEKMRQEVERHLYAGEYTIGQRKEQLSLIDEWEAKHSGDARAMVAADISLRDLVLQKNNKLKGVSVP